MTITSERSMRSGCRGNDKKQGVMGPMRFELMASRLSAGRTT